MRGPGRGELAQLVGRRQVRQPVGALDGAPHAEVRRAVLPADWPADVAGADLVIASEIGWSSGPELPMQVVQP